jgi:Spy/CpxP family protein refolding chaperone
MQDEVIQINNQKKRSTTMKRIFLVVAMLALFSGFVIAAPPAPVATTDDAPPPPMKGHPGMMQRQIVEEQVMMKPGCGMGLADSIQNKIKPLKKAHQREMMQLKNDLHSAELELKLAMTADKWDNGKVDGAINKISDLKKKILIAKTKHQKAVRDLLPAEQQYKFDQKILSGKGCGMGDCGGKGKKGKCGPGGCDMGGEGPWGKMSGMKVMKMMGGPGGGACKMGRGGDDD